MASFAPTNDQSVNGSVNLAPSNRPPSTTPCPDQVTGPAPNTAAGEAPSSPLGASIVYWADEKRFPPPLSAMYPDAKERMCYTVWCVGFQIAESSRTHLFLFNTFWQSP